MKTVEPVGRRFEECDQYGEYSNQSCVERTGSSLAQVRITRASAMILKRISLGLCLLGSVVGCNQIEDCCDEVMISAKEHCAAEKAWHQWKGCYEDVEHRYHFGYLDPGQYRIAITCAGEWDEVGDDDHPNDPDGEFAFHMFSGPMEVMPGQMHDNDLSP